MYLIKNGTVHVGDGRILDGCDILTEGTRIEQIAPEIEASEAQIIDASGSHVFPGFIDPHSAIGNMGIPGRYLDHNEATNPITPEMNSKYSVDPDEVNAQEFYKSGITALGLAPGNTNVMGGQIVVVKSAPMKMAERIVKEKAVLKCCVAEDTKKTYGERKQLPMTRMGSFYLLKESIRAAKAQKEEKRSDGQKVICEVFEKRELPVFVAASSKGEIDGILHLMKEEEVPFTVLEGFAFTDCIEELKESGAGVIIGNINNLSQLAKNGMKLSRVQELIENGNLIAFCNTNGGYSEGREVFLWNAIELYRAGIDAEEIVKMMSMNPARMLGVDDRLGTLEAGKDADLCIFSGHPVTSYAARVTHCLVNGRVVAL